LNVYNILIQEFEEEDEDRIIIMEIAYEHHHSQKGMRKKAEHVYNTIFKEVEFPDDHPIIDETIINKVKEEIEEKGLTDLVYKNRQVIKESLDSLISDFVKSWALTSFNHTIIDFYEKTWFEPKKYFELGDLKTMYKLSDDQIKEKGLDEMLLRQEEKGILDKIHSAIKECIDHNNEPKKNKIKEQIINVNNIGENNDKYYLDISHPDDPENYLVLFIFGTNNKETIATDKGIQKYLTQNVPEDLKEKIKLPYS